MSQYRYPNMKKHLTTVSFLLASVCASTAHAETVRDYYKTVIQQKPYTVEVCKEVTTSGDKTGDALMGAIIGGIIGNNVTKDLPDGGTAGAIIGGMLGHNNSKAKGGVKTVCSKETRYNESSETIYSHSMVTFTYEGKQYKLRFTK